jgi:hypothetical protein
LNCATAAADGHLSQAGQTKLVQACPFSCGSCTDLHAPAPATCEWRGEARCWLHPDYPFSKCCDTGKGNTGASIAVGHGVTSPRRRLVHLVGGAPCKICQAASERRDRPRPGDSTCWDPGAGVTVRAIPGRLSGLSAP